MNQCPYCLHKINLTSSNTFECVICNIFVILTYEQITVLRKYFQYNDTEYIINIFYSHINAMEFYTLTSNFYMSFPYIINFKTIDELVEKFKMYLIFS